LDESKALHHHGVALHVRYGQARMVSTVRQTDVMEAMQKKYHKEDDWKGERERDERTGASENVFKVREELVAAAFG
jgi:hypothetical protein